jgi:hypothetical protein
MSGEVRGEGLVSRSDNRVRRTLNQGKADVAGQFHATGEKDRMIAAVFRASV